MKQLSQLRNLFHDLMDNMFAINVISYTFSDYLKNLDFDNLKSDIKKETSIKLDDIESYYKKACNILKTISKTTSNAGLAQECNVFINTIESKLKEIQALFNNAKTLHQAIQGNNLTKEKALNIAKTLHEFEPKCCDLVNIVKEFKNKLILLNKYDRI